MGFISQAGEENPDWFVTENSALESGSRRDLAALNAPQAARRQLIGCHWLPFSEQRFTAARGAPVPACEDTR